MSKAKRQLWSFSARASVISVPIVLVGLLIVVTTLQKATGWPSRDSETAVLVGVFILSLMPLVLALLDTIVERGAVIEYRGIKLDFSQAVSSGPASVSIPVNIGVTGRALTDSDTSQILETLRQAVSTDIVVVDLESGDAWWETRLLILVAGAVRLNRPDVIVFVGTDGGAASRFQGWAYPADVLRRLLAADQRYVRSYYRASAAARQWALVEPVQPAAAPVAVPATPVPAPPPTVPAPFPWMMGLSTQHPWMAFDSASGLPNELAAEQFLAADLGAQIEIPEQAKGGPKGISLVRLEELFRPVLHKEFMDETWTGSQQLEAFLDSSAAYVAVTRKGSYSRLLPRVEGLNAIAKSLATEQIREDQTPR